MEVWLISKKSVLQPVVRSEWLGKNIDLECLSISNSQFLQTRLFAALLQLHRKVVPVKMLMRVLGLVGWCAAPKSGHLPFLAGMYMLIAYRRSHTGHTQRMEIVVDCHICGYLCLSCS